MHILFFSARQYDRREFAAANRGRHELTFVETHLHADTAPIARGYPAICAFVNDALDAAVLGVLAAGGTRLIALRCAGYNNIDLAAAARLGLTVVRVPAYSPHAVAEHVAGLVLSLNRKLHRAYNRVRENNYMLDGLEGFDLHGKTVGVIGTGRIGTVLCRIMAGFGCVVLANDRVQNPALAAAGVQYVALEALLSASDIVSLHCPLAPDTRHLIDAGALARMKRGAMLINTSRGGLIDTAAVIAALKARQLGALGLDVYEQEADVFFEDLSSQVVDDDLLQRLLTFPNVIITGHQGFFTHEALAAIAETTLASVSQFERGETCTNVIEAASTAP
jgi:D-lactate dehydrogenase